MYCQYGQLVEILVIAMKTVRFGKVKSNSFYWKKKNKTSCDLKAELIAKTQYAVCYLYVIFLFTY